MTAMTAATLDTLSGGRFRLGLGVSGPQVSEGWHGVRFDKPLARTREYVEIVAQGAAPRAGVSYDGEFFTLPLPDGPGKALTPHGAPGARAHPDLPGRDRPEEPRADRRDRRRLARRSSSRPSTPPSTSPRSRRAGPKAGKTLEGFDVVPTVPVVVGDDVDACADAGARATRALHRRHGQPREELLQPARRADGLRGEAAAGAGPLPGARLRRRRGRGAVRVHRPHVADRPARSGCRSACTPTPTPGVTTLTVATYAGSLDERIADAAHDGRGAGRVRAGRVISWFEAIVLGIVQGLTEFLPISSTAHLLLVSRSVGWDDPGAAFTAVMQIGTETAVLIYFRHDIARIVSTWARSLVRPELRGHIDARMGWYVIVGTIPIAVLGLRASATRSRGAARNLWLVATVLVGVRRHPRRRRPLRPQGRGPLRPRRRAPASSSASARRSR